jgi:hypothetical protein
MLQLGPKKRADSDADQNLVSKGSKRKWQPLTLSVSYNAPATKLESVKSRLDFGEQGRANASSLESKCSAEPLELNRGQMSGHITVYASERNERKFSDTPSSPDKFSDKARRARMEISEEARGVYHNLSARTHRECFKNPFGSCKCGGMPVAAPAVVTEQGLSARDGA